MLTQNRWNKRSIRKKIIDAWYKLQKKKSFEDSRKQGGGLERNA